ncbi:nickel ABC transporter permease [Ammoniphilus sp. YIM 78166]|uniref:nickel ABC transporter permease n=1 Tax=Ammoniphilus sp. YIM 78166 TaxID=1644106 RepID=UPI00106F2B64|nr:nickel ABC transporter permease [Ammoniphilus sp. YIM 78166]
MFWAERALQWFGVVFLVSSLTFLLLRLSPGDPAQILLTAQGVPATEEALVNLREELGLTDSLWSQYIKWLIDVFTWQWGTSYASKEPVLAELWNRFPATLELAMAGLLVMFIVTVVIGVFTAIFSAGWFERIGRMVAILGAAIPSFWLGFILIYIFSVKLGWLPSMGSSSWKHLVLPALTLGLGMGAVYSRVLRTNMLELMQQSFVKAAKARGLSKGRILIFHLLKHAFLPIITMIGTSFAFMLGGSVIVETIFSWPGLGKYIMEAIRLRDYPVIQGYAIFSSLLFVFIHFIVDVLLVLLDPRLRAR